MSQIKIRQIEPDIGEEEIANVVDALKRKWITEGKYAKEFSELIKEETGSKYVVLVSNGTLGLYLSLLALGVGSGDEVVVPSFTFVASGASVAFTGAKPVFADVNISNYTIDVEEFRDRITSRTKN